jgi:tetratricopeptide (TPR) repeat protein
LLTESRVLFFYLGLLLFPHIRAFGLYHDDIVLSTGLLAPWTTLVSVLLWAGLVGLALWGVRRRALWSFAVLWYLVGHALESSLVSLELVYEHRNYLPSFGILFAVGYYLVSGLERLANGRRLAYPLAGLLVAVLAFTTFTRAGIWGDKYTVIEFSLRNHPNSSRTHGEYAVTNAQYADKLELSFEHWARAAQLNPSSVLELIEMDKVLAAQILALEKDDQRGTTLAARQPAPDDFDAPLTADLDYLKALDRIVAEEISKRLEARPMVMSNVAAMRSLQECVQSTLPPCVVLFQRAVDWHERAIENPRQIKETRAVLRLGLAKLYAYDDQIARAVEVLEAAVKTHPGQVHYLFELAALHLTVGNLDSAERAIEAADRNFGYSGFRHGVLRDLKYNLEQARKKDQDANPASG